MRFGISLVSAAKADERNAQSIRGRMRIRIVLLNDMTFRPSRVEVSFHFFVTIDFSFRDFCTIVHPEAYDYDS